LKKACWSSSSSSSSLLRLFIAIRCLGGNVLGKWKENDCENECKAVIYFLYKNLKLFLFSCLCCFT
jgi:hypothetical protein